MRKLLCLMHKGIGQLPPAPPALFLLSWALHLASAWLLLLLKDKELILQHKTLLAPDLSPDFCLLLISYRKWKGKGRGIGDLSDHRWKTGKGREPCLLHESAFGMVTGRTAQVQLLGSPSSEQDTMQGNPALTKLLLKPHSEHSSSPSFIKPERKGVTHSNSMSSEGRVVLLSGSTKGHSPATASRAQGHFWSHGRSGLLSINTPGPLLGWPGKGEAWPEESCGAPRPLPAAQAAAQAPCRQCPASARSCCSTASQGSGSSPAPTGATLLREIKDRTTLAGELLHSPKAGKSHALHLAMSLNAAAFPGKGEHNPH